MTMQQQNIQMEVSAKKSNKATQQKKESTPEAFNSSIGLIFSCLGCVVGTGNIWRFPRICAQSSASEGSLTFLMTWIIFLFLWSSPMILIEYAIGRYTKVSPVKSFQVFLGEKALFLGGWVTSVTFVISCYYSVVLGWCFYYLYAQVTGESFSSEVVSKAVFENYIQSYTPVFTHGISVILAGVCVVGGVSWIERANMVLVPVLLAILVFTFSWSLTQPHADYGIRFLFTPSWDSLTDPKLWVAAASQNAFDTGAAMGLFASYATYMTPESGIVKYSILIPALNNVVSMLCAITIFSTVFSTLIINRPTLSRTNIVDIIKTSGPGSTGLTFIWIPVLFAEFGFIGKILGILFFFCLSCAGISSLISNIELSSKTIIDFGVNRRLATPFCMCAIFLIGLGSALSIDFLTNQDFVWGFALIISGISFQLLVIMYGCSKFRRVVVNEFGTDDWHLPFAWVIIVHVIAPLEAIGLLVWWAYDLISGNLTTFYYPTVDSFMTTILEWIGVMLLLILLNVIVVYVRPAWLEGETDSEEDEFEEPITLHGDAYGSRQYLTRTHLSATEVETTADYDNAVYQTEIEYQY